MTVTVIVPIYNSQKYLEDFFEALEKNEFICGDKVILADNGSTDNSFSICERRVQKKPELYKHVLFNEKASSYATRNYAVTLAEGDILVFTDSDTKPHQNWIANIRKNIKDSELIAGKIELEVTDNTLWELYDTIVHLDSEKNAKNSSIATANMAVKKKDFFKVGYFEERFSGGDYDWSNRAVKAGLSIKYMPGVCVKHPTRKNFEQILKKEQRIAYGDGNHHKLSNRTIGSLLIKYFLKIFKFDTNVRCSIRLCSLGINYKELIEFNKKFMIIRVEQLKYAVRGFYWADVRKLNLK